MRRILTLGVCAALLTGCASHKRAAPASSASAPPAPAASAKPAKKSAAKRSRTSPALPTSPAERLTVTNNESVITLVNPLVGKVASVNRELRFAVLDFSFAQTPAADQRLSVYRQGLKVGEVKIDAAYARNGLVVADVVAGEVKVGDEVRSD